MATESKPPGSEEPILNVVGERVALGPLREDLLPLYGRWINDFSTISMLGLPPAPVTAEKERDWHEGRSRAENDLMFTIYERENLRPIGNTGLHGLDHRNRSASFGTLHRLEGLVVRVVDAAVARDRGTDHLQDVDDHEAGVRVHGQPVVQGLGSALVDARPLGGHVQDTFV